MIAQEESLMVSMFLFYRMILSKKSAPFWDHALAGKKIPKNHRAKA
jgi:hypothetical protein